MIGLALRLAVAGGREALVRLVAIAAAVAVGTGLLLTTLAGVHAADAQLTRYASMYPQETADGAADPLLWSTRTDYFRGDQIIRVDVAATGPDAPTPVGVPRAPGPGEFYASPALRKLLATVPADQLADRYPGRDLGAVGPAALTSPDTLLVLVGGTPEQVGGLDQVRKVTRLDGNSAPLPGAAVDLILGVVAGGLLFPVLVFIGTATRLGAARREQRFAAMRLVGATPRQISAIAAVEAALAAAAGAAVGFAMFFALRGQLAGIPFTGMPFFPEDMAVGAPEALVVAVGVPAGAAAAAWIALRRVRISPLGVTRRVTPRPPRVYRLIPLALGLAGLGFALVYRPPTSDGQTALFLPALLLVMVGLIAAGPWLTMVGARAMAARAGRPAALIAARRLADNPAAGFRAVGGVMLALFVTGGRGDGDDHVRARSRTPGFPGGRPAVDGADGRPAGTRHAAGRPGGDSRRPQPGARAGEPGTRERPRLRRDRLRGHPARLRTVRSGGERRRGAAGPDPLAGVRLGRPDLAVVPGGPGGPRGAPGGLGGGRGGGPGRCGAGPDGPRSGVPCLLRGAERARRLRGRLRRHHAGLAAAGRHRRGGRSRARRMQPGRRSGGRPQ
ncbi:FtsX-like permease family protein [Micromonospora aurantiaca (nom. illeg.)]|uniref:FtsX-like permease family protein n=1 Tax=Micromonospora aurantiaca (nom. illeg.) TaxID=47850 RepID=UPI000B1F1D6F|nr:FtsX-like permease family protein [Micromonospora aurantiaca]